MVDDGRALRGVEQPRAQADQAAGGDREDHERVVVVRGHLDQLAAALADQFHHRPGAFGGHFDHQRLERLLQSRRRSRGRSPAACRSTVRSLRGAWFRSAPRGAARRGRRPRTARCRRSARRAGRRSAPVRCISRSRRWRLVRYLPSRPASGEVLTPKVIFSVGSSTFSRGRARGVCGSLIVSPISTSSSPTTAHDVAGVDLVDFDAAEVVEDVDRDRPWRA